MAIEGRTVTCHLAFPLRPKDAPSFFPSVGAGQCPFGACTDGDFTMWHRHILHVPQGLYLALLDDHVAGAMGLRYCDKHKGSRIRTAGKKLYNDRVKERKPPGESRETQKKTMVKYDKDFRLGGLLAESWNTNFEEITGVIRAHPHAGVAALFLSIKIFKAEAMGLTKMIAAFLKNHGPRNIATGVYGQNTFATMTPVNGGIGSGKMGVGFTANCLEAGANASLKRALGMQSSLPVLNSVVQRQCRKNAFEQTKVGFSVRQDYTAKNPRACSKRYPQMNEEDTGAFFHAMWLSGQAKARDPEWVSVYVRFLKEQKLPAASWNTTSVYLPTKHGIDMALAMVKYSELDMVEEGGKTMVKKPEKKINIFPGGTAAHLRANCGRWKSFMSNPKDFLHPTTFDGMFVVDGRRELADPNFAPSRGPTTKMNALESYCVYEKSLLFYQHAYVHVTANPNVLSIEQAQASLPECWRSRKVYHAARGRSVPIDYGCFRCTCRQYAKCGFCEHCIIVGTLQRQGYVV